MLEFFRKFQKILFSAVALALVFSLVFFGIFSTINQGSDVQDEVVAQAVDGSDIGSFDLHRLIRFISLDPHDAVQAGSALNLLNDGVIQKDILETGLGALLVESYFDDFKEDLQTKLSQAKRYRPYAHPDAPFLSAQAVWDQFHPDINRSLASLKGQLEVSQDTFTHLSNLYLEQKKMPPELLRRILLYQMSQYSSIRLDPTVQYADFALFGYQGMTDWFGSKFIDLVAKFIWNAARVAEERGIYVSKEEAKADLLFGFTRNLETFGSGFKQPPSFSQQLQSIGMNERDAVNVWQKVLLFRRYLASVGESALVDGLFSQDLARYAHEVKVADVYSLPEALVLRTAEDFFSLQYYLNAVSPPAKDLLALPKAYLPIQEIAKKSPEFVETLFMAEIAQISKQELGLRISFKEILDWQLAHWEKIAKQFPALKGAGELRANRILALEKTEASVRSGIDHWARQQMVEEHPEWIEEAFQAASAKEQKIVFSAGRVNLAYVKNPVEFQKTLEGALKNEPESLQKLSCYADERSSLYRFTKVEKTADLQIRSFLSMKQDGSLRKSLDGFLQNQYPKLREKSPGEFQTKAGEWKPFNEVKEAVGWAVFADVCQALDGKGKKSASSKDFYIRERLAYPMRSALESLKKGASSLDGLEQFCFVCQEKKIQRTLEASPLEREAFLLPAGHWSSLHVSDDRQMQFFYMKEQKVDSEFSFSLGEIGKALIVKEAKQMLAKRLIHRMQGVKNHV